MHQGNVAPKALYVSDLDGTLLRSDGTVSAATSDTIRKLLSRGLSFTVATARGPSWTLSVLQHLHLRLPLICLNGAVTVDPHTGNWLTVASMPSDVVEELLDIGVRMELPPFLLGRDDGREALVYQRPCGRIQEHFIAQRMGEPRLRPMNVVRQLDDTLCVTFAGTLDSLSRLNDLVAESHPGRLILRLMNYPAVAGGATLDVSMAGVDKVARVAELAVSLEVQACDVVVFGDEINDLPMFAWAGTAVAVGNARPEVLVAADRHCGSNEADGVAEFLMALVR